MHTPWDLAVYLIDGGRTGPVAAIICQSPAFAGGRGHMTTPLEPEGERNERIFAALPKLGSEEYLALLRRVPARDLPAPVLVRAYRQLGSGRAAEATLERLLLNDATYGYLRPLRRMAPRKVSARDWFSADDLVDPAIGEIALALAGPRR